MARAIFQLPNGTNVSIEGTPTEVKELLDYYSGGTTRQSVSVSTEETVNVDKPKKEVPTEKKAKPTQDDLKNIIHLVKTCPEAGAIENRILDKTNEANRVLLPLYIVHEYFEGAFGLTTTEISEITIELGAKVSRQNSLRALKFTVPKLVIKQGKPPRYKIQRRGLMHIKTILQGEEQVAENGN